MRRLLALALYLFIGLPAILGTLFLVPMRGWILDRDFYKAVVSGPEARAVLESPALYERIKGPVHLGDLLVLSGEAAGKALEEALPVSELLSAAGGGVDSAFDALESGSVGGRLTVDMTPLKAALDLGIPELSRIYAADVPVSPPGSAPPAGTPLDLSTRPADIPEAAFREAVGAALEASVARIPDLAEGDLPASGPEAVLNGARSPRDALDRTALWMALLAGGVWVAGAFVASDSAGKRLRWLGRTLLLPGLAVLAAGAVLRLAADPLVLRTIRDPELQRFLADPSLRVVRDWIRRPLWTVSTGFLVSGSLAVILGGGLAASRKALRYRDF